MRHIRAPLRTKCENAPLRRRVTEHGIRSTPNAFGVDTHRSGLRNKKALRLLTVVIGYLYLLRIKRVALQALAREARLCGASSHAGAG